MINIHDLKSYVVDPVLQAFAYNMNEREYEKIEGLLYITAFLESGLVNLKPSDNKYGIYGIKPVHHFQTWSGYILSDSRISFILSSKFGCSTIPSPERIIYDLQYATLVQTLFYKKYIATIDCEVSLESLYSIYQNAYEVSDDLDAKKISQLKKALPFLEFINR